MARRAAAAASCSAFCLIGAGIGVTAYTETYNYSTNSGVAGSVLGLARYSLAATGNANVALFGGGYISTDKYFYSSASVKAGTNMAAIASNMSACSSSPGGL